MTTSFSNGAGSHGNTFEQRFKGALRITRAGRCRVTGGDSAEDLSFTWTTHLNGSGTCNA